MAFFAQGEGSTDVPRLLPSCFKKELSTGARCNADWHGQVAMTFIKSMVYLGLFCILRMRKWIPTNYPEKPTWNLLLNGNFIFQSSILGFRWGFGIVWAETNFRRIHLRRKFLNILFFLQNRMWWRFLEHVHRHIKWFRFAFHPFQQRLLTSKASLWPGRSSNCGPVGDDGFAAVSAAFNFRSLVFFLRGNLEQLPRCVGGELIRWFTAEMLEKNGQTSFSLPSKVPCQLIWVCKNCSEGSKYQLLGGGFRYFLFSPLLYIWGRFPFWRAYFSIGLVQPPPRLHTVPMWPDPPRTIWCSPELSSLLRTKVLWGVFHVEMWMSIMCDFWNISDMSFILFSILCVISHKLHELYVICLASDIVHHVLIYCTYHKKTHTNCQNLTEAVGWHSTSIIHHEKPLASCAPPLALMAQTWYKEISHSKINRADYSDLSRRLVTLNGGLWREYCAKWPKQSG